MAVPEPSADVVTRASTLAAASSRPTLTTEEVRAAVKTRPLVDADGLTSEDPEWTPTWDLNAAVAELWGVKAGRVAGDFNFSADDGRFDKGEVMAHCLAMEALYSSRRIGAASTLPQAPAPGRGVVVNG